MYFLVTSSLHHSSCSNVAICSCSERRRPERLMSRLKSTPDDGAPRLVALRQPRGPDGSKGFAQPRKPWATLSAVARPIGRVASAPEVLSVWAASRHAWIRSRSPRVTRVLVPRYMCVRVPSAPCHWRNCAVTSTTCSKKSKSIFLIGEILYFEAIENRSIYC